jgi:hypothetical protein
MIQTGLDVERTTFSIARTSKGNFKIVKREYHRNGRTYTRQNIYSFKTEEEAENKIKLLR